MVRRGWLAVWNIASICTCVMLRNICFMAGVSDMLDEMENLDARYDECDESLVRG